MPSSQPLVNQIKFNVTDKSSLNTPLICDRYVRVWEIFGDVIYFNQIHGDNNKYMEMLMLSTSSSDDGL